MADGGTSLAKRVPASWLYVGYGARQTWARLNGGDRLMVGSVTLFALVIIVQLVSAAGKIFAKVAPQWTALGLGVSAFACVALSLTLSLSNVRQGRLFQFLGETSTHRTRRIGAEFAVVCFLSALLLVIAGFFVKSQAPFVMVPQAIGVAVFAHGLVHVTQYLSVQGSPARRLATNHTGLSQRSKIASVTSGFNQAWFKPTSSRFLLKALTNPFIWALLILTMLASGGAAVSLKSPLLGVSTFSTLLLIIQLTLAEPRVGNGRTIGASSKNMPIQRAVSDFMALSIPHLACFVIALALTVLERNGLALGIASSQLALTLWIIWIGLLVRALPSLVFTKSTRFLVAGAIVASQVAPPLIVLLLIIGTLMSTRDLMRLSRLGPAQWPT